MSIIESNASYFLTANPNIEENTELRDPQIKGFYKVYEHFVVKNKTTHAIIVLPTGVGKTGLIALLPYHICKGKVLIITPQITIKDTVIDSLDPENPNSFWYKRDIFKNINETPVLVEYDKTITREILDSANIVILNIHKLQSRLAKSPLNFLDENYFDMIIIDEAHHSTANTWVETIRHFKNAKIVKLTGTPIRTDKVDLVGELVYKYKLSQAMNKGYVKSLRNSEYIPEDLRLTLDNDETKEYSVEELLKQGIRDEDWIGRSVAYSKSCSTSVVEASIKCLEHKRRDNCKIPHKIIAVACSIVHAEKIKQIYIEKGYRAEVIHSDQEKSLQSKIKSDIKNHRLDVIINVSMLGEGYDHPYLSIAAIFRPFRNELPYEQFIGRVLRAIPEEEVTKPDDNIADVVSHSMLFLSKLWEKYKIELHESDVIKYLQEENSLVDDEIFEKEKSGDSSQNQLKVGHVVESGIGSIKEDVYLTTELIRKHKEDEKKQNRDIIKLQQLLSINYEQALSIYNQTRTRDNAIIRRPDLYFASLKKNLDVEIREIIVPELITKYNIEKTDNNLAKCRLFNGKYNWISKVKDIDNSAMLARYLNTYMKNEIGKPREKWTSSDFDNAFSKLPVVCEYIEKVIDSYLQNSY